MKLHGIAVSNFYNVVKTALLEKGLEFEEVLDPPSREETYLAASPMGKLPFMETEQGFLSESHAILVYLEKSYPTPALYPPDPFLAGRTLQIHQIIDHYVDTPARTVLGAAFFGRETSKPEIEAVSGKLAQGIGALARIVSFDPFIAGKDFSHADLAAFYTIGLAQAIMVRLEAPDPLTPLPGYKDYHQMLAERPAFQKTIRDRDRALAQILSKQTT